MSIILRLSRVISWVGFVFASAVLVGIGIHHLTAPSLMNHHLEVMGTTWEDLTKGIQWMTLNFQRSSGTGYLVAGTGMLVLLLFPFRKKEFWSVMGIYVLGMMQGCNLVSRALSLAANTGAHTSVMPGILISISLSVSLAFSLVFTSCSKRL